MSINVKKYTKDQMAKMVEEAAEKQEAAEAEAAAYFKDGVKLAEENEKLRGEIANLKADADALRNKLDGTEAALGRANVECAFKQEALNVMRDGRYNAEQRANYAEAHPWRNLWAWVKRKLVRHE